MLDTILLILGFKIFSASFDKTVFPISNPNISISSLSGNVVIEYVNVFLNALE